jgi:large subunit ribosomal protein L30
MIAAVKVRGNVDVPQPVKDTMTNLGLKNRNQIVFYEDSDSVRGMMNKAKDYITYGEVSEEVIEKVKERYEKVESGKVISARPPSKGFRDTRRGFNQGGSLGERKSLDSLIERMV